MNTTSKMGNAERLAYRVSALATVEMRGRNGQLSSDFAERAVHALMSVCGIGQPLALELVTEYAERGHEARNENRRNHPENRRVFAGWNDWKSASRIMAQPCYA
jgi:hypothetical protein